MPDAETAPGILALAKALNDFQRKGLATLAADPSAWVEAATKSKLRKLGLVGRHVSEDERGRQKTTSPLTEAGKRVLEVILRAVQDRVGR